MQELPQYSDYCTSTGHACRYCGSLPAAMVTFRAHRGMIFVMQFRKAVGPFCRNCGIATFRRMQCESLVEGWWGLLSSLINPLTMLLNLPARREVARLAPPESGVRLPIDPGTPMIRRPQMLMLLLPLLLLTEIVVNTATAPTSGNHSAAYQPPVFPYTPPTSVPSYSRTSTPSWVIPPATTTPVALPGYDGPDDIKAGDCVWNQHPHSGTDDDHPSLLVVGCTDPHAEAKVLGRQIGQGAESRCETFYPDYDIVFTVDQVPYGRLGHYALCMKSMH